MIKKTQAGRDRGTDEHTHCLSSCCNELSDQTRLSKSSGSFTPHGINKPTEIEVSVWYVQRCVATSDLAERLSKLLPG